MTRLVFIDVETTGVHPDRRVWEIGMIERTSVMPDVEQHLFVDSRDLDLGNADGRALNIGRFHERHPEMAPTVSDITRMVDEYQAMQIVERVTRDAILVGVNVQFDAEVLANRMRYHGIYPAWDFNLIEVKSLCAGYLVGLGGRLPAPPWSSGQVTEWLGLPALDADVAHTALGDARHVKEMFDVVAGRTHEDDGTASDGRALDGLGDAGDREAYLATLRRSHSTGLHDAVTVQDCPACTLRDGARAASRAARLFPAPPPDYSEAVPAEDEIGRGCNCPRRSDLDRRRTWTDPACPIHGDTTPAYGTDPTDDPAPTGDGQNH